MAKKIDEQSAASAERAQVASPSSRRRAGAAILPGERRDGHRHPEERAELLIPFARADVHPQEVLLAREEFEYSRLVIAEPTQRLCGRASLPEVSEIRTQPLRLVPLKHHVAGGGESWAVRGDELGRRPWHVVERVEVARKLQATFHITILKTASQIAVVSVVTEAEIVHREAKRGCAGLLETDAENARLRGIQRTRPPAIAPERRSPEAATLERAQHWQNYPVSHHGVSTGS